MWVETMVWWAGTWIFAMVSIFKEKLFMQDKSFSKDKQVLVKTKNIYIKTVKQQKDYIRAKSDLGQDFVTMVVSIIIFYLAFTTFLYRHIKVFYIGVIIVIVFAALFSYIYTKYFLNGKHFIYNMSNSFMNKLYVGVFLVYIKFFGTIYPLLLLIGSIIIMLGTNYFLEWMNIRKWRGNDGRDYKDR